MRRQRGVRFEGVVVFCLVESLLQGFKESFEDVPLIAAVWVSLRILFD